MDSVKAEVESVRPALAFSFIKIICKLTCAVLPLNTVVESEWLRHLL